MTHANALNVSSTAFEYQTATPYPNAIIDDFLPPNVAEEAFDAFPTSADPIWARSGREYINAGNGRKYEMSDRNAMPAPLQRVVDMVHSSGFNDQLCKLTGLTDLIADPSLMGGGLNLAEGGGFLRVHADFNFNNELQAYRTVNVLVYFSKGWKAEFGGNLELWERDLSKCAKTVLPKFNRAVIFTTFSDAYHGVSPVNAPDDLSRRSMNFYFYRKDPIPGIRAEPHKTLWQKVEA